MAEEFNLDDWSNNTGPKFEKKNFLEQWQKRPGHKINLFLHTRAGIVEQYSHSFYRVYDYTDKDTRVVTRKVAFTTLNCHESTDVSRKRNKRDAEGKRVSPPQHCPLCKLAEWARDEVNAGRLSWTDKAFEFSGKDGKGNDVTKTVYVGGLYNAFGGDKLSDDQKAQLRRAGIEPRDAWRENHTPKGSVVMRVVDADNLDKGIQIAVQPTSIGDAIKKVIRDTKESLGDHDGNPIKNPYCIQLDYNEKEPVFSKKYEARMIQKIKCTPEVLELIRNTDPPELGTVIEPFDAEKLRPQLEKAARIAIPFDEIFATAKKVEKREESAPAPKAERPVAAPAYPKAEPPKAVPLSTTSAPSEELYECDNYPHACTNNAMKGTDPKCTVCGKVYIAEPEPPPPPARPKRGAPVQAAPVAPPPPPAREPGEDDDLESGDELPF